MVVRAAAETPSPEAPWVYHVFGLFGKRDSLVVTEDDFFDYLIATSTDKLMPRKIRGSLLQNSLLFLGFRLDDWRFRVLFRTIMTMQGAETLSDYSHVGVQVNPDEHQLSDVKRAMSYMTSYFQEGKAGSPRISIFWGSAEDFLKELRTRLAETEPAEMAAVGDRLDTDIVSAKTFGCLAVLVLTGISTRAEAERATAAAKPDIILNNLTELPAVLARSGL